MRQLIATTAAVLLLVPALSACAGTDSAATADAAPAPPKESAMPAQPPEQTSPSLQGNCDAAAAQKFVGQAATADVVEQARTAAGANTARTLKPGQMVTMEFRAGRLNLDVDDKNVITSARCG